MILNVLYFVFTVTKNDEEKNKIDSSVMFVIVKASVSPDKSHPTANEKEVKREHAQKAITKESKNFMKKVSAKRLRNIKSN